MWDSQGLSAPVSFHGTFSGGFLAANSAALPQMPAVRFFIYLEGGGHCQESSTGTQLASGQLFGELLSTSTLVAFQIILLAPLQVVVSPQPWPARGQ